MSDATPEFNRVAAHRFFAADCFNRAWDLLDLPQRSMEQNDEMILLALTSLWHWNQREDCTDLTLSIGHWQVSRAYALAGRPQVALHHARRSYEYAAETTPFYRGYALEGEARAWLASGNVERFNEVLNLARDEANAVEDPAEREALEADLAKLEAAAVR